MKLCRFRTSNHETHIGLAIEGSSILDLSSAGVSSLETLLEAEDLQLRLESLASQSVPRFSLGEIQLCAPVERQEVWAAGVTYLRSKKARMEESDFSATAYDRVYEAERPEIFFKSLPEKVVVTGDAIGIRKDARWNVPEPELALVLNSHGNLVGYTIGNDMSSRDIEGENLLYLPQAKTYSRSCALGPFIRVGVGESEARSWEIRIQIQRAGDTVFSGDTSVSKIKRSFKELISFLFRSQEFPHGAVLLTGTGVVPQDHFTLEEKDVVRIEITGIGILENPVIRV
jgi:2-dehydro-3-deoxy-D-arabinonate dehydratase